MTHIQKKKMEQIHLHFLCNTSFICHFEYSASLYTVKEIIFTILNENICFKGLLKFSFLHTQKIKIFRVGIKIGSVGLRQSNIFFKAFLMITNLSLQPSAYLLNLVGFSAASCLSFPSFLMFSSCTFLQCS